MDITNPAHPLNPLNPLTDPVNIYGTHDTVEYTCVPTPTEDCLMSPAEVGIVVFFTIGCILFCAYMVWKSL